MCIFRHTQWITWMWLKHFLWRGVKCGNGSRSGDKCQRLTFSSCFCFYRLKCIPLAIKRKSETNFPLFWCAWIRRADDFGMCSTYLSHRSMWVCAYTLCLIPYAVRACVRGREESEEGIHYMSCVSVCMSLFCVYDLLCILCIYTCLRVLMGACVEIDASVFLM